MQTVAIVENSYPLAEFQKNADEYINRMKETREPLALTVNGQVEAVVLDAESYDLLVEAIDRAEAIEGIRRGLESMKNGEGTPASEFFAELRKEFNFPDRQ